MSRIDAIYPADRITLREVGLRDGLQIARSHPATEAKLNWLEREAAAGVRHFEIGSFLPAGRFPQFADVGAMIEGAERHDLHSAALTLNERGAEAAFATAIREMVCVVSATEEHSEANMRRSRGDAVDLVRQIAARRDAEAPGKIVNAGIAMAFGCSLAGDVAHDEVLRLADACLEAGADIVGLADTVGYAGPKAVGELCARMSGVCAGRPFIIHLHDTRGMGVANAAAALDNGARVIDASLGGLGGCPFAPGATGNVVFEDIVYLAETMGFATGIDLDTLKTARRIAEEAMPDDDFHGALHRAGPPQNARWRA
ncbi:hydroxymethylglutaryl-CoA lyase [Salinihabitans flavidus]|uniref:Hydroxymethylglutaryl-CoA lyase n=1 Tax=Salinihabitans flavidus TaxID=569882 RepID=A0A1H8MIS2_9RHOB|nr:hydroxymethylglutaryl-CoA lyase [Salinihabitans flavidus]SEO17184.1 hydroxymethylglutaryl-CoA lyase [Salinihabitans flavidus]